MDSNADISLQQVHEYQRQLRREVARERLVGKPPPVVRPRPEGIVAQIRRRLLPARRLDVRSEV